MAPAHAHNRDARACLRFPPGQKTDRCANRVRTLEFIRVRRCKRDPDNAEVVVSQVFVRGEGAVSTAGWGVAALRTALARGEPLPMKELSRSGRSASFFIRGVPPASPRPEFLAHGRLRRASPIAQYAVAAALEALGSDAASLQNGSIRLGIV